MVNRIYAIRGATTIERDDADHVTERTGEMIKEIFSRNNLDSANVISLFFTATSDLHSIYPATAARNAFDLGDIPLMGAQELDVEGALPMAVRVIVHVNAASTPEAVRHVFLHGAIGLRRDLSQ